MNGPATAPFTSSVIVRAARSTDLTVAFTVSLRTATASPGVPVAFASTGAGFGAAGGSGAVAQAAESSAADAAASGRRTGILQASREAATYLSFSTSPTTL